MSVFRNEINPTLSHDSWYSFRILKRKFQSRTNNLLLEVTSQVCQNYSRLFFTDDHRLTPGFFTLEKMHVTVVCGSMFTCGQFLIKIKLL